MVIPNNKVSLYNCHGKEKYVKLLLVMYLFANIFTPPILPKMRLILDFVNCMFLMIYVIYKRKIIISNELKNSIYPFVPFLLYICFNCFYFVFIEKPDSLQSYETISFFKNVFIPIYTWISVVSLCFILHRLKKENQISVDQFTDYMLIAGMLQFLCALLALIFPGVRDLFLQIMSANTDGSVQSSVLGKFDDDRRCYGFAANLFDSIGYVTAFLASIAIIKAISRGGIKYFVIFLCFVFFNILNTRTGVLLTLVSLIVTGLYFFRFNAKSIFKYGVIIVALFVIGVYTILVLPESNLVWVESGWNAVSALVFDQEATGIFATLLYLHFNFPKDIVFGDGTMPDNLFFVVSDIGYINCIWRYGVLGTILLFGGVIYFFIVYYKKQAKKELKCFVLCSMVIFFIYLIKLFSLYNIGAYAAFIPVFVLGCLDGKYDEDIS